MLLLAALLAAEPSAAQDAFSRISLSGGRAYNVNENDFHDSWAVRYAGEAAFATPFYAGEAELGAALHRYDAVGPDVPRFDAVLFYLGWGLDLSPFEVLSWQSGFDVGTYRMTFDEETFPGVRNESEVMLGLNTRIRFNFSRAVSLYAIGRRMRIYTDPRLELTYVSAGIRVTIDSPNWLMTILR